MRHSVILAPLTSRTGYESAAVTAWLNRAQLRLSVSGVADASGRSGWQSSGCTKRYSDRFMNPSPKQRGLPAGAVHPMHCIRPSQRLHPTNGPPSCPTDVCGKLQPTASREHKTMSVPRKRDVGNTGGFKGRDRIKSDVICGYVICSPTELSAPGAWGPDG